MNASETLKLLERGGIYCLGEYRGGKAETVNYRDKLTGKSAAFSSIAHHIESGNDMLVVQERVPEGSDTSKFTPPYKKATRILVKVETLERIQGFLRATGSMSPVEG